MKFLVDAQIPVRLARALAQAGHDATHTSDLPDGNRSSDAEIAAVADAEDRVVVSKDADFQITHQLVGRPRRLLVVAMGNVSNAELLAVFQTHLGSVITAFDVADRVEVRATEIVAWPRRSAASEA